MKKAPASSCKRTPVRLSPFSYFVFRFCAQDILGRRTPPHHAAQHNWFLSHFPPFLASKKTEVYLTSAYPFHHGLFNSINSYLGCPFSSKHSFLVPGNTSINASSISGSSLKTSIHIEKNPHAFALLVICVLMLLA